MSKKHDKEAQELMATLRYVANPDTSAISCFVREHDTLEALWAALKSKLRHNATPRGDWWSLPSELLKGCPPDADEASILVGACLTELGIEWKLRAFRSSKSAAYHHVYPVAIVDGCEVVFDLACGTELGHEPRGHTLDEKRKD